MQGCYSLPPKRSGLFRHDIIQKKHSIIQQGIKSPPEHCIPTVENSSLPLCAVERNSRLNRALHRVGVNKQLST